MNSQEAINKLQPLLANSIERTEALQVALDVLTNGFTEDSTRIDTEIQKGKDEVAAEMTGKDTQISTLTKQVTNLTAENTALKTPVAPAEVVA